MPKFIPHLFMPEMVVALMEGTKTMTRRIANSEQCPYSTGDIIWVKESHYRYGHWKKAGLTKTGKQAWRFIATKKEVRYEDHPNVFLHFKSRVEHNSIMEGDYNTEAAWYERSSLFLPKKFCRLFQEVTNIKSQSLHQIDNTDVMREGIDHYYCPGTGTIFKNYLTNTYCIKNAKSSFCSLWMKIHGAKSWEANPKVWAISFNKIAKPNNF